MATPTLDLDRTAASIHDIASAHGLTILGRTDGGWIGPIDGVALTWFLADVGPGATYLTVVDAEIALTERLGTPIGIRLVSEIRDPAERARVMATARPV